MADPTPTPAEAAAAEIANLKSGADPDFSAAYFSADAPGHSAAVERLNKLHETAYAEQPEAPAGSESPGGAEAEGDNAPEQPARPLPLQFSSDASGETVIAAHKLANETVASLGLDPNMAHGSVAILERSIAQREQKPMDTLELAHMESVLEQRMGDQYGANMAAVNAALKKAGKGGEWLRKAILASGPETAVLVMETLAAQLARPKE